MKEYGNQQSDYTISRKPSFILPNKFPITSSIDYPYNHQTDMTKNRLNNNNTIEDSSNKLIVQNDNMKDQKVLWVS